VLDDATGVGLRAGSDGETEAEIVDLPSLPPCTN
jgi:hypothetical protein